MSAAIAERAEKSIEQVAAPVPPESRPMPQPGEHVIFFPQGNTNNPIPGMVIKANTAGSAKSVDLFELPTMRVHNGIREEGDPWLARNPPTLQYGGCFRRYTHEATTALDGRLTGVATELESANRKIKALEDAVRDLRQIVAKKS